MFNPSCDTFVQFLDDCVIFGKNSDRSLNESQEVNYYPRQIQTEEVLQATYIQIPQIKHTYAVLLCQPKWVWGAEMGSNEFGVTIGNEAIFTKGKLPKQQKLTGLDLVRLGLERSKTAKEALLVIINLVETHGQGGNCSFDDYFYYYNCFLITDSQEAYILDTHGYDWAYKKYTQGKIAISNVLNFSNDFDECSQHILNLKNKTEARNKKFNMAHRKKQIKKIILKL